MSGVYLVKLMKLAIHAVIIMILFAGIFVGCTKEKPVSSWSLENAGASVRLKNFIAAQEILTRSLAKQQKMTPPVEFDAFFQAAKKGDWQTTTNLFQLISKRVQNDDKIHGSWWRAMIEAEGVFEIFPPNDKYATTFGDEIIQSIPSGSIFFGGTDRGWFTVTALSESHASGKPFYTFSPNAFADGTYLDYLRSMYGEKIYTPTAEDSEKSFEAYVENARKRLQSQQLKPGEDVSEGADGHLKISGQVALMQINWLLAKTIFDKNTNREFYLEEGFAPGDWMYPHLEPHGLIMKINRQPPVELSDETVKRDHEDWTKRVEPMIGNWLEADTSVEDVCAFARKIYLEHDLSGFKGDPQFIQNDRSCRMFSWPRSSIADLYVWRMNHALSESEKKRMTNEADFAFRQAIALCPYSPNAVFRYVNFLLSQNRLSDAHLIAKTATEISGQIPSVREDAKQYPMLVQQIEQYQKMK